MRQLIDLSHTIRDGLVTYPGLPAPHICDFMSREASKAKYAPGTEFQIGRIDMVANTGTYVDSPFHRYADGRDLSQLALESLADVDGLVVRAPAGVRALGPELFEKLDVRGRAVLIHTGWSRHFGTPAYFEGHPFITRASAELLRDRGARLVGIDSLNIDDTADGSRPAHTVLLGADIPLCEHMTGLERAPDAGFRFFAVPAKVEGFGTWPVRAFAIAGGARE